MSQPRNSLPAAREAGYTLAELVVVLIVLALAVALIAPRVLGPSPVRDQRAAVEALIDMAGQARARALLSGDEQRLVIDVDQRTLSVEPAGLRRKLPASVALTVTAAEAEIIDLRAGVRFFPDGAATGGEVRFDADGAPSRTVVIQWATGLAREDGL